MITNKFPRAKTLNESKNKNNDVGVDTTKLDSQSTKVKFKSDFNSVSELDALSQKKNKDADSSVSFSLSNSEDVEELLEKFSHNSLEVDNLVFENQLSDDKKQIDFYLNSRLSQIFGKEAGFEREVKELTRGLLGELTKKYEAEEDAENNEASALFNKSHNNKTVSKIDVKFTNKTPSNNSSEVKENLISNRNFSAASKNSKISNKSKENKDIIVHDNNVIGDESIKKDKTEEEEEEEEENEEGRNKINMENDVENYGINNENNENKGDVSSEPSISKSDD